MHTKISTDFSGMTQEAVNVELHNNVIKTVTPKRNAVIIDFVEHLDGDDMPQVKTVVTIECLDDHLYDDMKEYALQITRGPCNGPKNDGKGTPFKFNDSRRKETACVDDEEHRVA